MRPTASSGQLFIRRSWQRFDRRLVELQVNRIRVDKVNGRHGQGYIFFAPQMPFLHQQVGDLTAVRVNEDFDPSVNFTLYETYDWMPGPKKETGDVRVDNRLMERRIMKAIERALAFKGFQKTPLEQPDFFVSYYLSYKTKYESNTVYTTMGFGGFYPYGGLHPFGGVGFYPSFEEYEEGTLLIDVSEGKEKKLVWRGSGKRRVDENASPEKTTTIVNQTVQEILDQFPPKGSSGSHK